MLGIPKHLFLTVRNWYFWNKKVNFIQFITLPQNEDPDSFVNNNSINEFLSYLKNPISLVNFIFHQASLAYKFESADDKIIFDKYIDEIIEMIKDRKNKIFL